jgi:hypothetical protein
MCEETDIRQAAFDANVGWLSACPGGRCVSLTYGYAPVWIDSCGLVVPLPADGSLTMITCELPSSEVRAALQRR